MNLNGSPDRGNMNVQGHTISWNQMPHHGHNYDRPNYGGRADSDDGTVSRGANNTSTGGSGGNGGHNHGLGGQPNRGNMGASLSLNIVAGHNLGINGNPQVSGGVSAGVGNLTLLVIQH